MAGSEILIATMGSLMGGVPAAIVAYRQGRRAEEKAHDRDVEERLDDLQWQLDDVRGRHRERRGR